MTFGPSVCISPSVPLSQLSIDTLNCFATDTSSYFGVTAHFIDSRFQQHSIALALEKVSDHKAVTMEQTMIAILEKFNVKFCVRSISADNTSANTAFVRSFLARLETELVAERRNRRESGSGAVMYGPRLPQTLFPTFVEGWDYMIGCGGHVIALGGSRGNGNPCSRHVRCTSHSCPIRR